MLDLAAKNARVIYMETVGATISRRQFLTQLAEELMQSPHDHVQNILEEIPVMLKARRQCQISRCSGNKA